MWYFYVLKSQVNNRFYTGSTNDLERRLYERNSGHSTYTRLTKLFKLVYKEEFQTRLAARRREIFLKTGKGRAWLKIKTKDD